MSLGREAHSPRETLSFFCYPKIKPRFQPYPHFCNLHRDFSFCILNSRLLCLLSINPRHSPSLLFAGFHQKSIRYRIPLQWWCSVFASEYICGVKKLRSGSGSSNSSELFPYKRRRTGRQSSLFYLPRSSHLSRRQMSWLRSAVSKAVEVANKNNLTRTVRNYTHSIVQHASQAVAEGAKRFQDRMGGRSFRSVKKSIQKWEEATVSCRGPERLEILRRWVLLLKEVERLKLSQNSVEEKENVPAQPVATDDMNEIQKRISLALPHMCLVFELHEVLCWWIESSSLQQGVHLNT